MRVCAYERVNKFGSPEMKRESIVPVFAIVLFAVCGAVFAMGALSIDARALTVPHAQEILEGCFWAMVAGCVVGAVTFVGITIESAR
jgi:hypothetical protein